MKTTEVQYVRDLEPPRDPLAAARARGVAARERLLEKAGGTLRVSEVAELLGVTRTAINARRTGGTLLAVPLPNGEHVYPACQFTDAGVPAGLGRFLAADRDIDPWTQLSVLLAPSQLHAGRSALELIQQGEPTPRSASQPGSTASSRGSTRSSGAGAPSP
jgi:hypothetical protein